MGTKRTAAGTAAAAERRAVARDAQAEALGPIDAVTRTIFDHCRFIAAQAGIKQGRRGDIVIELSVPYEYRAQALGMFDASGQLLSVDVIPWKHDAKHGEHDAK